jgi:hypothetical protein
MDASSISLRVRFFYVVIDYPSLGGISKIGNMDASANPFATLVPQRSFHRFLGGEPAIIMEDWHSLAALSISSIVSPM